MLSKPRMNSPRSWLVLLPFCGSLLLSGCAHEPTRSFPAPKALPAQAALPDPLVKQDGTRVASRTEWMRQRRPELRAMFEHYMYGAIPPKPDALRMEVIAEHDDFLNGQATLRLVTLRPWLGKGPKIDLAVVVPNRAARTAPVFLVMNFCGNQAIHSDARIPLAESWVRENCKGAVNNRATDAGRGAQAADWPLEEIVRRGYAVATFYSGDVDPDREDASTGLYAWLAENGAGNNPTNRGTIAAWAWGYQRCVDYLEKAPGIDGRRIAALGHSRNGKTALLAAAFDDRIAVAFPHQAGCGGSAPSRGKTGESVKAINDRFPHWFNGVFKQFNDSPEKLPFDQNALVALCAPRPVLFSAAQEDQWANPAGQFQVLQAATPVYEFLGVKGLEASEMPPHGKLVDSRLGYYIREGKHSMTADDWRVFMDYADKWLKRE